MGAIGHLFPLGGGLVPFKTGEWGFPDYSWLAPMRSAETRLRPTFTAAGINAGGRCAANDRLRQLSTWGESLTSPGSAATLTTNRRRANGGQAMNDF